MVGNDDQKDYKLNLKVSKEVPYLAKIYLNEGLGISMEGI